VNPGRSPDPQRAPLTEDAKGREPGPLRFPAEVTFANARDALERAASGLEAARPRFDLSACRYFDSSLIGVLLELARRASSTGRRCTFVGASANLRKLCGLYDVDALLFGDDARGAATASRPVP